jgi:hypothetical protein
VLRVQSIQDSTGLPRGISMLIADHARFAGFTNFIAVGAIAATRMRP